MKRQFFSAMAILTFAATLGTNAIPAYGIPRMIKEVEYNDIRAQNLGIDSALSKRISGKVGKRDRIDAFRLRIRSNKKFIASLTNSKNQDADLELILDANKNGIVDAGDSKERISINDGDTPERINKFVKAGDYIIRVVKSDAGNSDNYYQLSINM
ncbi:hypothetical protein [Calothrix rhizosoleniae]|uniref:hypothetical protein n=1 Tax=Calothrix rhizosoleniae TaxID=888997 RepID=UPI000B498C7A|nr:hypothetical protein [Calothrix rhizosoleniae]